MAKSTVSIPNPVNIQGPVATELIQPLFYGTQTLTKNLVRVLDGVKGKYTIPNITVDAAIQPDSCEFTPNGGLVIASPAYDMHKFKLNEAYCKQDFEAITNEARGAQNTEMPLEEAILSAIVGSYSTQIDKLMWTGSVANGDVLDGFLTKFDAANSGVVHVPNPVALTKTNILDEMERALESVAPEVEDLLGEPVFIMSNKNRGAYRSAMNANGTRPFTYAGQPAAEFAGYRVEFLDKVPANRMVITTTANLIVATDSEGDFTELRLIDTSLYSGDDKWLLKGRAMLDVNVARPAFVTVY